MLAHFDEEIRPEETQDIPLRSSGLSASFILKPIKQIMHTKLDTIGPDNSIAEAAQLMAAGHFGCLPVVRGHRLVGILSERDILTKIVAKGLNPAQETVASHMTNNPETIQPDDEIAYALNIMAVGGFRHVPIIDEDENLIGIFSIKDLKRCVLEHFEKEILTLPPKPTRQGPLRRYAG